MNGSSSSWATSTTFASEQRITDTAARLGWTVTGIDHDWATEIAES